MKIIGTVGQNGSGKDEVLKYLKERYGVPFISTGDIVRSIAVKEDKEKTRENLREISERYFRKYGQGIFVKMAAEEIAAKGWKAAGISGIRSAEDVKILKKAYGDNFILINVYVSDPQERYRRMTQRGAERDPKSYEQFMKQDAEEEELFKLKEAAGFAQYSLANDGSLKDLHKVIDTLINETGILS